MASPTRLSDFEEDLFESVENEVMVKMEEEEENTKKSRRKRKPKRDFSPDIEGGEVDSQEAFEEEEEKKPKKRGRKKKKKEPEVPDEELTDLQHIFRVVESLMTGPNAPPFLDKPDHNIYGMSDYFEIITKPMWLREVERKYGAEEYTSPTEIAADVRLMLENCYHYWGPCDTLSKRALKLEQAFETKLAALPEHVKQLCTLEATHGDIVKEEPDETSPKTNKKGGYTSKLLNWVVNGKNRSDGSKDSEAPPVSQEMIKAKRELRAAAERELTIWETEHMFTDGAKEQIASMWEFPVIGQFLHLVYNVLNIDPISHLELERMLLIPQASKTLATLITSMIIPPFFRAKLEGGPAMPYSVWTRRLHTKLCSWYRSYHSKGDNTIEVFDSLGIEPQFWLVMGDENPLNNHEFHELNFLQRVWLLKGLCDFLLHNHKTIQDRINNLETEELREMRLGKDQEGYTYHYFPNFNEVRIYKMAKVPDTKWKNYEGGVEEALTMCAAEDEEDNPQESNIISEGVFRRPLHKPPRSMRPNHSDFKLVCESLEDIRKLVDQLSQVDSQTSQDEGPNAALVRALQNIITDLEPREAKMELAVFKTRNKMRNEWLDLQNRSPNYVDPGIAYWERKEKEEKSGMNEEKLGANLGMDVGVPGTSADGLTDDGKRERRTRRESSLKLLSKEENGMDDESQEESPLDFDDDSEDEWFASKKDKEIKKKKEKKLMSAKKMKKLADISDKMQQSKDSDKLNPLTSTIKNNYNNKVGSSIEPVKIKEELPDPDETYNKLPSKTLEQANVDQTKESLPPKKQFISVKKEFMEGSQPNAMTAPVVSSQHSVIQTLVPPVNATNVKMEKASKPIAPDLSKVKRSNSPEGDVVYISDSEDSPDIKPSLKLLNQRNNVETINYVVPQQQPPMGNYILPGAPPNQGQFVPVNVAQPQVYQPTQPIAYQMQSPQQMVQQPVIRPNPTIVRLQATPTRPNIPQNQKFVVLQPNSNNTNQPNQFVNKGPRAQNNFPTTPTMQNVNWFGGRGGSPRSNATYSPRQRGPLVTSPIQSPRGRGSPRGSPVTPPRGGPRFSGRSPATPNSMRMPAQVGPRIPSPLRGRGPVAAVRPGPVRNLNFNRSPAKPVSKPVNEFPPESDSPDIEGTLVVSMTDTGGFGYAVMLPDGGKISLTQDQLAKIRSDNGGTLPKRCKVPLNTPSELD
ncbi:uncharacterized protein LOC128994124 isoform X2 [Macrosteles quadrilineatus]|uniref:uncharacterized protein LOC128994124 isoform X2 n=1 Tax=Macrosteles quadrilineatus TaxID=74068 RepID=UPI0023E2B7F1|nr:uncharacterized protein LOC128994124 isoform X2 [Macrosteles quadrilineatus]